MNQAPLPGLDGPYLPRGHRWDTWLPPGYGDWRCVCTCGWSRPADRTDLTHPLIEWL